MHEQYVIAIDQPAVDGKVHKLEIKLKHPGLTARVPRSYVAASAER